MVSTFEQDAGSECLPCASGRYSTAHALNTTVSIDAVQPYTACVQHLHWYYPKRSGPSSRVASHVWQEGAYCCSTTGARVPYGSSPCAGGSTYQECMDAAISSTCLIDPQETVCAHCPSGKYSTGQSYECITCPVGLYAAGEIVDTNGQRGPVQCSDPGCKPGQHTQAGACLGDACVDLFIGSYSSEPVTDQPVTCSTCPSGKYRNADGSACTSLAAYPSGCPPGMYGPEGTKSAVTTFCIHCPVGKYSVVYGASTCLENQDSTCTTGRFGIVGASTKGDSVCTACPNGKYNSAPLQANCTTCDAGKHSTDGIVCTTCPGGTFTVTDAPCSECPDGYYRPENANASVECQPCGVGTRSSNDATNCVGCTPGMYQGTPGSNVCIGVPCEAGTYGQSRATSHQTAECTQCPAGKYQPATGQDHCIGEVCPVGMYGTSGASTMLPCFQCPGGKYQPDSGQHACDASECPQGRYSDPPSVRSEDICADCLAGQWQDQVGQLQCKGTPCTTNRNGTLASISTLQATCKDCPDRKSTRLNSSH